MRKKMKKDHGVVRAMHAPPTISYITLHSVTISNTDSCNINIIIIIIKVEVTMTTVVMGTVVTLVLYNQLACDCNIQYDMND